MITNSKIFLVTIVILFSFCNFSCGAKGELYLPNTEQDKRKRVGQN